jgi:hypothetical protein
MPITASPQPSDRPSRIAAVMPLGSSVGWLGWSRTASVPGRPIVLRNRVTIRAGGQKELAEVANGQVSDLAEGRRIVRVEDEAGDVVGLVGDQGPRQDLGQRDIGQAPAGGGVLLGRVSGDPGQPVPGADRRRLGHQRGEVREGVGAWSDDVAIGHANAPRTGSPDRSLSRSGAPVVQAAPAWGFGISVEMASTVRGVGLPCPSGRWMRTC